MGMAGDDSARCWGLSLCCLSAHCLSHDFRLPIVCLSFVSRLSPARLSSVSHMFVVCLSFVVVCLSSVLRMYLVCLSSAARPALSVVCRSSVMHIFCIFSVCRLSVAYLSSVSQQSAIFVEINFLFIFGLSALRRLFIVRLSSACISVSGMCRLSLICLSFSSEARAHF